MSSPDYLDDVQFAFNDRVKLNKHYSSKDKARSINYDPSWRFAPRICGCRGKSLSSDEIVNVVLPILDRSKYSREPILEWSDAVTEFYLLNILQYAHLDQALKITSLELIARVDYKQSRGLLSKLKAVVRKLTNALAPVLIQERTEKRLNVALSPIVMPAKVNHKQISSGKCATLSQMGYCAIFDKRYKEGISRGFTQPLGGCHDYDHMQGKWRYPVSKKDIRSHLSQEPFSSMLVDMLLYMSHFIIPHFQAKTSSIGRKVRALHKPAPVKEYGRIAAKIATDYKSSRYPEPKVMHVKDTLRTSIVVDSAARLLQVWKDIRESFQVVDVKNDFRAPLKEIQKEKGGMHQILVNVVFNPIKLDVQGNLTGQPLTYGDICPQMMGSQLRCSEREEEHSNSIMMNLYHDETRLDNGKDMATFIACYAEAFKCFDPDKPVVIVAELQLHLRFYFEHRKTTHMWFKILRAGNLKALRQDCWKYRTPRAPLHDLPEVTTSSWTQTTEATVPPKRLPLSSNDLKTSTKTANPLFGDMVSSMNTPDDSVSVTDSTSVDELTDAFAVFDKEGDGYVSLLDLRRVLGLTTMEDEEGFCALLSKLKPFVLIDHRSYLVSEYGFSLSDATGWCVSLGSNDGILSAAELESVMQRMGDPPLSDDEVAGQFVELCSWGYEAEGYGVKIKYSEFLKAM